MSGRLLVGTAGWSLPVAVQAAFPAEGTHLQRYARRFPVAEINSSFYRPHRPATYARWATLVPDGFRFAVKIPKAITHERKLVAFGDLLDAFLAAAGALGDRLGVLLVQLPPKLALDVAIADEFFRDLRARFGGPVALEPRHASWFDADATRLLVEHRITRVAADPPRVPSASEPGGDPALVYYRLHGSPRTYWSAYDDAYLDGLAARMRDAARGAKEVWCIFDNTASGAAAANALSLLDRLA
ncbi:MAG: DUF72 domain-containing protein [Gemmatimonadaceae bacterium]|nr:DUF72 domain-containing protein [Gemmatimonadaceae bacterium]